ncbi:MAG: MFS transporter [Tumebacillaceae bacterium]
MSRYGTLLRNPHFFKFMLSNVLLDLGKKLSWVALSWFVYQTTGSSLSIGIVISTATIAPVVSSLLVGSLLDRYDRRTLLVAENLLRGVILAVIPLLYGLGALTLPVVVAVHVVVFIIGSAAAFEATLPFLCL